MTLKSYDLKFGKPKYVPDDFFVVHEAQIDGRTILEGEKIEKGSVIDLVVGNGFGNTIFQSPLLLGLDMEEAQTVILGSGLKVGKISFVTESKAGFTENDTTIYRDVSPGAVQNQYPKPGVVLKIGDIIDMSIYRPDSLASDAPNILDN